jgi:hypothetical protein
MENLGHAPLSVLQISDCGQVATSYFRSGESPVAAGLYSIKRWRFRSSTVSKAKRGRSDSFWYSGLSDFRFDQANSRIFLPGLGWLRYRNSRNVLGQLRDVTVSNAGEEMVCIHPDGAVGRTPYRTRAGARRRHGNRPFRDVERRPVLHAAQ